MFNLTVWCLADISVFSSKMIMLIVYFLLFLTSCLLFTTFLTLETAVWKNWYFLRGSMLRTLKDFNHFLLISATIHKTFLLNCSEVIVPDDSPVTVVSRKPSNFSSIQVILSLKKCRKQNSNSLSSCFSTKTIHAKSFPFFFVSALRIVSGCQTPVFFTWTH